MEENNTLNSSIASYRANLDTAIDTIKKSNKDIEQLKEDVNTKTKEFNEENKQVATLTANNNALVEKLDTQKKEIEELAKKFNTEFENIATKILDEKTLKFTKQNKRP